MSESSSSDATLQPFDSGLDTGWERFLAQVIVQALSDEWQTPDDFLRHFGPDDIVSSLADNDDLRSLLLVKAAGVHERLAPKKSIASGSEDLTIALAEKICEPAGILEVYPPDDRVRHLDKTRLWNFAVEGDLWSTPLDGADHTVAVARIVFLLERALDQELITRQGILEALTFDEISERLPEDVLRRVLKHALEIGSGGTAVNGETLDEAVPLAEFIGYFPVEISWEQVVLARIAVPNALVGEADGTGPGSGSAKPKKATSKAAERTSTPPKAASAPKSSPPAGSSPRASAPPGRPSKPPPSVIPPPPPPPPPAAADPEDEALAEAAGALEAIGRLPPSFKTLSVPLLRSIESMYADLAGASDDGAREDIIRESFPNEALLRKAMLALIELLDPSINTAEPLIRDADVDALIKIVLFEERRRDEQRDGTDSSRGASRSVPARRV